MKSFIFLLILLLSCVLVQAQKVKDTTRSWEASAGVDNNFLSDQFLVGLNGTFDRKWLHLEARYNCEDFHTISFWGGYNFSGGNDFNWTITPLLGTMFGTSKGLLPGISIDFDWENWEFTNETALVVYAPDRKEDNYIYTSNELDYSIDSLVYVGVSVCRSKIYQTKRDLQTGICAGVEFGDLSVSFYIYNLFIPEAFGLVSLSYNF